MASRQFDAPGGAGHGEHTAGLSEPKEKLSQEDMAVGSLHTPEAKSPGTTPDAQSDVAEETDPGSTEGSGPVAEDAKETAFMKLQNMEEIALHALHVEDNPSLNPWTFRTWFLGIGGLKARLLIPRANLDLQASHCPRSRRPSRPYTNSNLRFWAYQPRFLPSSAMRWLCCWS